MAEFGRASHLSSSITRAFASLGNKAGGRHIGARLVRVLLQVIKSDVHHRRGYRCVTHGNLHYLEGFEFNDAHQAPELGKLHCRLLRAAEGDEVLLRTDAFAADLFLTPQVRQATHFTVNLLAAAISEEGRGSARWRFATDSPSRLVAEPLVAPLELLARIEPAQISLVYCAALSVKYFRFSGDQSLPYEEGRHDLLRLVKVFSA